MDSAEWGGEFAQDDEPSGDLVGIDPWSAVLPGPSLVPAYLASRFAAQYRAVIDDAATYLQAVGSAGQRSEADLGHAGAGTSEAGIAVDALAAAYEARGRPLHEENLLTDLLADLDSAQLSGPSVPSNS